MLPKGLPSLFLELQNSKREEMWSLEVTWESWRSPAACWICWTWPWRLSRSPPQSRAGWWSCPEIIVKVLEAWKGCVCGLHCSSSNSPGISQVGNLWTWPRHQHEEDDWYQGFSPYSQISESCSAQYCHLQIARAINKNETWVISIVSKSITNIVRYCYLVRSKKTCKKTNESKRILGRTYFCHQKVPKTLLKGLIKARLITTSSDHFVAIFVVNIITVVLNVGIGFSQLFSSCVSDFGSITQSRTV